MLEDLLRRRRDAERSLSLFDELRRLESTRSKFEVASKQESEKRVFDKVPISATDELAETIREILTAWNYHEIKRVAFDSSTNDIAINGKPRGSHGKGYRAITYAAFAVGLMLFCRKKGLPHPGFVVLDSPLVTYRKPEKRESDDDLISDGMVPPIYENLSKQSEDCQVLVIENDLPRRPQCYQQINKQPLHEEP